MRPNKNIVSHLRRVAGVIVCFLWCSPVSFAHPMGNFSINHYAGIHIDQGFIELRYLIDMAEIPTFQEMQQKGFAAKADDPRVRAYLSKQAEEFRKGLFLTVNDQPQLLETTSQDILFTIGAGNLPTMKLGLVYRAAVTHACTATHCTLVYRDTNFAGRVGWKELIASPGKRIIIEDSSAPLHDRSGQLSNYPTDMVSSPPQDVSAKIIFLAESVAGASSDRAEVRRGPASSASRGTIAAIASGNQPAANGPPSSPSVSGSPFFHVASNRQRTPRNSFTELINPKQISLGIVLLAAIVAAGLGALHALEPGHGKTIVAAYLVGSKGTARHALLLGMIVTIAHTAGVYFLGGITLYAQKYVFPDRIYPFLGVLSGILIAGMGCYLFLQRFVGAEFTHSHVIPSAPTESWQSSPERRSSAISTRQLLILGTTGGIVPCPAALVVLLSAVALHRTGFGLFLIVAFSIGLAAVLIAMGLAAVFAGRIMSRLPVNGSLVQRWLPMASALMITGLGCLIAVRGLIAAGIVQFRLWS